MSLIPSRLRQFILLQHPLTCFYDCQDAGLDRLGQLGLGGHDGGKVGGVIGAVQRGINLGCALPLRCQRVGRFS